MKLISRSTTPRSILGLALDADRLEGFWVHRVNGSAEVRKTFTVTLSLDPLSADAQLVGREIRQHLDRAGIRERACAVCLPAGWELTHSVALPDLPAADLASFLQLEAERAFPVSPEGLMVATSNVVQPDGARTATLFGVPREQITRLEAVLHAAGLKPRAFSLALPSLVPASPDTPPTLALLAGQRSVTAQVNAGGGIALLRTLEAQSDTPAAATEPSPDPSQLMRDLRISLGQLAPSVREHLASIRIMGRPELADAVAAILEKRSPVADVPLERVRHLTPTGLPFRTAPALPASPALALAFECLAGRPIALEFLPPRLSRWQAFTQRHSSRRLAWTGAAAAGLVFLIGGTLLIRQARVWHWSSRWDGMASQVRELDAMQQQIRKYRPWFDESVRSLAILRRLTEAFPEDGTLTAKSVEIRAPATVICTGTARDRQALLRSLDRLRAAREVTEVKLEQLRGKTPLEFTFNFQWVENAAP